MLSTIINIKKSKLTSEYYKKSLIKSIIFNNKINVKS